MRILLLGKHGQLGWELRRTLATLGELICLDYPKIDLIHPEGVLQTIRQNMPEIVINATAYTQVDQAESEPELANAINGTAPGRLAEACAEIGAAFIHYSTDYVFDGSKGSAYIESDRPNPINIYGGSKLAGEQAITQTGAAYLIFRTSWVYSNRRGYRTSGDSFLPKVLSWARQNPILRIVDDQIGNPTWARMLAEISAQLLAKSEKNPQTWIRERSGIYHLAGDGPASRLEWAKAILRLDPHPEEQICQEIQPAQTSNFITPAKRPLYSALDCALFTSTFALRLPPWEKALQLAMEA